MPGGVQTAEGPPICNAVLPPVEVTNNDDNMHQI
jgi:hypothetical protein